MIIDKADSPQELDIKEQYWIKFYKTMAPIGYNLDSGGKNRIFSKISKQKMSKSAKNFFKNNPNSHPMQGKIGKQNWRSKPVICITTGKTFESARQAGLEYNVPRSHVSAIARKDGRKSSKGLVFAYL